MESPVTIEIQLRWYNNNGWQFVLAVSNKYSYLAFYIYAHYHILEVRLGLLRSCWKQNEMLIKWTNSPHQDKMIDIPVVSMFLSHSIFVVTKMSIKKQCGFTFLCFLSCLHCPMVSGVSCLFLRYGLHPLERFLCDITRCILSQRLSQDSGCGGVFWIPLEKGQVPPVVYIPQVDNHSANPYFRHRLFSDVAMNG